MEFVNCPRCGKVFQRFNSPICKSCEREEEETFENIKKYLDENDNCTLQELADHTGISPKRIMRFIRQGRIEISTGMQGELTCESCGIPIRTGRFCDSCFVKVTQEIEEMRPTAEDYGDDRRSPRMHTAPNIGAKKRL